MTLPRQVSRRSRCARRRWYGPGSTRRAAGCLDCSSRPAPSRRGPRPSAANAAKREPGPQGARPTGLAGRTDRERRRPGRPGSARAGLPGPPYGQHTLCSLPRGAPPGSAHHRLLTCPAGRPAGRISPGQLASHLSTTRHRRRLPLISRGWDTWAQLIKVRLKPGKDLALAAAQPAHPPTAPRALEPGRGPQTVGTWVPGFLARPIRNARVTCMRGTLVPLARSGLEEDTAPLWRALADPTRPCRPGHGLPRAAVPVLRRGGHRLLACRSERLVGRRRSRHEVAGSAMR